MHFIEQFFGINLDAGSGSLEYLLFIVPISVLYFYRRRKLSRSRR